MAQAQQPLSQVVPLLVAALVCDVAVSDPGTNKKNLIGIFDHVNVSVFPTRRPMSIYFKIGETIRIKDHDFVVASIDCALHHLILKSHKRISHT